MSANMDTNTVQLSRYDFKIDLITRAWKNETFRQELLHNPKTAIEKEFGLSLPNDLNVEVPQEDANTIYITLPVAPNLSDMELSEEELETVAGGGWVDLAAWGQAAASNEGSLARLGGTYVGVFTAGFAVGNWLASKF